MRMLLKAVTPTDKGNAAIQDGRMQGAIQQLTERLNPEAIYFYGEDGKRAVVAVFDMEDSSQLPAIAEPLFSEFEASLYITPAMNPEDLAKGLQEAVG